MAVVVGGGNGGTPWDPLGTWGNPVVPPDSAHCRPPPPPTTLQCLNVTQLLVNFGLDSVAQLTPEQFTLLCPALLYQIDSRVCIQHSDEVTLPPPGGALWPGNPNPGLLVGPQVVRPWVPHVPVAPAPGPPAAGPRLSHG